MNAKYIISSFLEACENTAFQGRWMTADRWAMMRFRHLLEDNWSGYGASPVEAIGVFNRKHIFLSKRAIASTRE